jgi:hypothetical protein
VPFSLLLQLLLRLLMPSGSSLEILALAPASLQLLFHGYAGKR